MNKKQYITPEMEVSQIVIERNFLASGENLTSRSYGSNLGEDEDDFWD